MGLDAVPLPQQCRYADSLRMARQQHKGQRLRERAAGFGKASSVLPSAAVAVRAEGIVLALPEGALSGEPECASAR